jgi:signal transduction histidine kinase/integral membrane sensor domain MASE1/ActR/RegA family two-component response regulator
MMVASPVTSPFPQHQSKTVYSFRFFLEALGVIVIYFAAARIGLSLASINANVSPIWPPTGLAIAAVILLGNRVWPAILIGAFLANYLTPVSLPVAAAIAIGNTLEAVTAARFLRRFEFHRAIDRAKDVFVFVVASFLCTIVSATIGTLSVYLGGFAAKESLDALWWTWWLGDSVGAVIVAPLILVWSRGSGAWSSKRYIEATIIFVFVAISTIATFSGSQPAIPVRLYPIIRLTVPFFIWAAFRLGQRGITVGSVIVSIFAVWGTTKGLGVFAGRSTNESLILLQMFLGSNAVMFLFLAATVEERRSVAQTMRKGQHLLAANLAVTRILAESPALNIATNRILETIGTMLNWQVGDMWMPDSDGKSLKCLSVWNQQQAPVDSFKQANLEHAFLPGIGLPGRVWSNLRPVWISDVTTDNNFPRGPFARTAGLRSAFAFPILCGERFLGVMEFFSTDNREPDDALLTMFSSVGNQIGQFVERKRAEEEREQLLKREHSARSEAELANRTKDEFLAMVSHELRTPLNAIVGWSAMMRRGSLDKDRERDAIEIIERNAKSQAQLIDDILDVSRIVSGKLRLDLKPTQLHEIVSTAVDSIRPLADAKSIRLKMHLDRDAGPVSGDSDRLQQIVWNLLSNAVKFTPAEGEIEISLINAGERVEIIVRDTGQGIAPDVLPHIFDRFRQADSSKTRRHGGLGLGLAIVHHLVQLHNGTITAHSDGRDKGSEFRLVIPCIVHAPEVLQGESQRPLLGPSSQLSRLSILVVDDDADSRNMLEMALRSQGADVATAASVREALATLDRQDWRPALLLSDLGMPEQDGYDLIRLLRARTVEDGGQLPAIALTGYAGREEGEKTLKEGYQAHLSKPVDWSELIKTIASLTENGR